MFKSILVPGMNATCNPKALELGLKVARLFEGRVECLHVHPDSRELARYTTTMDVRAGAFTGQVWEALIAGDKTCAAVSRMTFESFCASEHIDKTGAVTASWREVEGNDREQTIIEAFYSDVVVFAHGLAPDDLSNRGVGEVLVACGRPVLLAPSNACANPLSTVVIAWKETAPSARAVAAALPLLQKAETIHVLSVAENGDDAEQTLGTAERLANYLRRQGLKAQAGHVQAKGRNACDVLLEAADQKLHAGLLVMGAYGHSRAREFIFGGFTRSVLRSAPLPVFLSH